ncbi:MAG: beta-glucosidase, partial [Burkholderiales bacterium]|nr:beta-glucosidase [Burkholderiales bacterium]
MIYEKIDNISPFKSFFQGGFECSTHHRNDGVRLDLLAATLHDIHAYEDYEALAKYNIHTVRDGLRWHLIETKPYQYDWSSFIKMLHAAKLSQTQVIWDLCHYGWPDDLDIWRPDFVKRFTKFAAEAAKIIKEETQEPPFYIPINEISFWSWAGGDVGYFNPHAHNRGFELKQQLVRAALSAMDAIKNVDSRARFIQAEPAINKANLENQN